MRLSALGRRPTLVALAGALAIAFSGILYRLSEVSPETGAFFRCLWALPPLLLLAAPPLLLLLAAPLLLLVILAPPLLLLLEPSIGEDAPSTLPTLPPQAAARTGRRAWRRR